MDANEVAILPYYIANLNIEFTYGRMQDGSVMIGIRCEFLQSSDVLTLFNTCDNLALRKGSAGEETVVQIRQSEFNLTRAMIWTRTGFAVQEQIRIKQHQRAIIVCNPAVQRRSMPAE